MSPPAKKSTLKKDGDKVNALRFFADFGRHCINDFLHFVRLFPGMPGSLVCESEEIYERFRTGLVAYIAQFETDTFKRFCCTRPSGNNFLSYSLAAAEQFTTKYMAVFRKSVVAVSPAEYNLFVRSGLLDPNHYIGVYQLLYYPSKLD
jgi:hypothetical protein